MVVGPPTVEMKWRIAEESWRPVHPSIDPWSRRGTVSNEFFAPTSRRNRGIRATQRSAPAGAGSFPRSGFSVWSLRCTGGLWKDIKSEGPESNQQMDPHAGEDDSHRANSTDNAFARAAAGEERRAP
jgi:hypothetical protein